MRCCLAARQIIFLSLAIGIFSSFQLIAEESTSEENSDGVFESAAAEAFDRLPVVAASTQVEGSDKSEGMNVGDGDDKKAEDKKPDNKDGDKKDGEKKAEIPEAGKSDSKDSPVAEGPEKV